VSWKLTPNDAAGTYQVHVDLGVPGVGDLVLTFTAVNGRVLLLKRSCSRLWPTEQEIEQARKLVVEYLHEQYRRDVK